MSTGGVGHDHHFDPASGWCHFCNLRDDGRLIDKGGGVFREGRGYTPAELHTIRETIERNMPCPPREAHTPAATTSASRQRRNR